MADESWPVIPKRLQEPVSEEDTAVAFPVRFYVKDDKVEVLKQRARELDDAEVGDHQLEYTLEQAVVVVFHQDPTFLFPCLVGWCHDGDGRALWDEVKWAGEEA